MTEMHGDVWDVAEEEHARGLGSVWEGSVSPRGLCVGEDDRTMARAQMSGLWELLGGAGVSEGRGGEAEDDADGPPPLVLNVAGEQRRMEAEDSPSGALPTARGKHCEKALGM